MTPDIAHVVPHGREQLADHSLRLSAVGALEVAVLDERDRRRTGAPDVVTLWVDVVG